MRVALTGHLGYVGSVMTPMIVAAGHDVVGFDSDLYRGSSFASGQPGVEVPSIFKDIRDITEQDLEGFDAVIHLAGLSNDPLGDLNPTLTDEINFKASVHLAEIARSVGVERFLFSSSCSNYGAGVDDWLTEESEFNPVTPYGQSKVDVERSVSKLANDEFSPTFLRSGTAYGVSPRLRFDLVLNNLTAWAFCTGEVLLKSDGKPWRPIVHIEDMSRAFLACLEAPRDVVHNEAFNVGRTSENYQIRDIAEIVASVVEGSRVEFAASIRPRCSELSRELRQAPAVGARVPTDLDRGEGGDRAARRLRCRGSVRRGVRGAPIPTNRSHQGTDGIEGVGSRTPMDR